MTDDEEQGPGLLSLFLGVSVDTFVYVLMSCVTGNFTIRFENTTKQSDSNIRRKKFPFAARELEMTRHVKPRTVSQSNCVGLCGTGRGNG